MSRSSKRAEVRAARERDRLDLLSLRDTRDEQLRGALVILFSKCDPEVLAAFGTIIRFAAQRPARRR